MFRLTRILLYLTFFVIHFGCIGYCVYANPLIISEDSIQYDEFLITKGMGLNVRDRNNFGLKLLTPQLDGGIERIKFQIDPLGLVQFGPSISFEMRISRDIFVTPHFRYYYAGLLYHGFQTDFWKAKDVKPIPASMGLGVSIKYLLGNINRPNRYYVGGLVEYGFGGNNEKDASTYGDKLNREAEIIIGGLLGHKWRINTKKSRNISVIIGAALSTKYGYYWEDETGQPWHSPEHAWARFYYLMELQFAVPVFTQIGKRS